MYLPRSLISHLYNNLLKNHQPSSSPVLVISSLDTDAICACRILASLFKRDFIQHRVQPVTGYGDLQRVGHELVRPMKTTEGGSGGVVICLGVGGLVDLASQLGLEDENDNDNMGGVEVWVLDARRPWNLSNVFGGYSWLESTGSGAAPVLKHIPGVDRGCVQRSYRSTRGGIIVFDDGDIMDELCAEQEAFCSLAEMPEIDEDLADDSESEHGDDGASHGSSQSRKRKSWSDRDDSEDEAARPQQRRRSNSGSTIASDRARSKSPQLVKQPREPSARQLRRKLQALRISHEKTLQDYYTLGTSYSEPISSLAYSLASELGREDNDLLWLAIVGVTSLELSGHTSTGLGTPQTKPDPTRQTHYSWRINRSSRTYALLRDEVRRLNPPSNVRQSMMASRPAVVSARDSSIQLVPDPRFMLLRHWSLYDSMFYSPYLAARLHVWNESGVKRLHKLLAKMGISLQQCKQGYMHMNVGVRADLRDRLLKYANLYGLEELVPVGEGSATYEQEGWGFLRTWGWKAQLSAVDVGMIVSAILETVAPSSRKSTELATQQTDITAIIDRNEALVQKYWKAYDALAPAYPNKLLEAVPSAQRMLRAIHRTGSQLLNKHQIRHLRAFRMGIVKEGPDLGLFADSPGALVKLALWVAEAVAVSERDKKGTDSAVPLVLAALDEARGTYVIVGTGGGVGSNDDVEARKERAERRAKKQSDREARRKMREEKKAARKAQAELNGDSDVDDEEEESEEEVSDDDHDEEIERARESRGCGRNRFGIAFQEVVEETNARVKIDSFDHCVVEVKKEDLQGFLEGLSLKNVVGK